MDSSICKKTVKIYDIILLIITCISAVFSILLLIGIIGYVIYRGVPGLNIEFLSTVPSALESTFGILGNIINTLYIVVITLLIAVPIGIGAAIYLNEYAKRGKIVQFIEFTTETLAGIPSIIYGLFGMVFFGITLNLGFSIICGCLTLTIMVFPIIIRTSQEALKAVPDSYRAGASGLGASKWHMIKTIILPSSINGIVSGIVLSVGRIAGESAALLFTAGSSYFLPKSIFSHIFNSGGTLTIQMYLSMSKAEYENAFAIALILIIVVVIINSLAKLLAFKR